MYGIFTYIGIIWKITLGVNVGKYSNTMDPLGMVLGGFLISPSKNLPVIYPAAYRTRTQVSRDGWSSLAGSKISKSPSHQVTKCETLMLEHIWKNHRKMVV